MEQTERYAMFLYEYVDYHKYAVVYIQWGDGSWRNRAFWSIINIVIQCFTS